MSMLRYYMTPETRQSLIAESNRLIAMRAAIVAVRQARAVAAASTRAANALPADGTETDEASAVSESAFARLVAELEATSQTTPGEARPN
jgi:hypothetical protein